MLNWLIFCSFVFSFAMTLLGVGVDLAYQLQMRPEIEKIQTKHLESLTDYLKSEKHWQSHPLFRTKRENKRNLSELLQTISQGDLQNTLVPLKTKKEILSLGGNWLEQKHKIKYEPTIDAFFSEVQSFDHWHTTDEVTTEVTTGLVVASQIFLAYTFYRNPESLRQALEKTRHLSSLLLQAEPMNLKRTGLSLLEKEQVFMNFLNSRFLKTKILWSTIEPSELRAYRQHLARTSEYLSPLTSPEVLSKVFQDQLPIGFCGIFKIKQPQLQWAHFYLGGQFPLEPDFSETISHVQRISRRAKSECRTWSEISLPPLSWARFAPYYRRLYGVKLLIASEKRGYAL